MNIKSINTKLAYSLVTKKFSNIFSWKIKNQNLILKNYIYAKIFSNKKIKWMKLTQHSAHLKTGTLLRWVDTWWRFIFLTSSNTSSHWGHWYFFFSSVTGWTLTKLDFRFPPVLFFSWRFRTCLEQNKSSTMLHSTTLFMLWCTMKTFSNPFNFLSLIN